MSHSVVYVLLKQVFKAGDEENLQSAITHALAPFYEGKEVDPYDRECYCRGVQFTRKVEVEALSEMGYNSWNHAHKAFHARFDIRRLVAEQSQLITSGKKSSGRNIYSPEAEAKIEEIRQKMDNLWQNEIVKPFKAKIEEIGKRYPDTERTRPDPQCVSCQGTGVYESTYNPKSKWDWYSIGGRWDGQIQCRDGGGVEGRPFNNTRLVKELLYTAVYNGDPRVWCPFAVLTPDGEWHERGQMGRFGLVADDKGKDPWKEEVKKIYEAHRDCLAVAVDVHI